MQLSRSQIDKLGERLRTALPSEDELIALDQYRQSFAEAYSDVMETVGQHMREMGFPEPTGRSSKSTTSITEKLRRESIRLSQMQDIAGCRVVVPTILEQEQVVEVLTYALPDVTVIDRREKSSHGYRAVHLISVVDQKMVEVQVRTKFQHAWAEMSERFADSLGQPEIKYGKGNQSHRDILDAISALGWQIETLHLLSAQKEFMDLSPEENADFRQKTMNIRMMLGQLVATLEERL